jgi:hypothetical protein
MVQEFLTAWILWYYGNEEYPGKLQEQLTYDQKVECMKKTEQIKRIVGRVE